MTEYAICFDFPEQNGDPFFAAFVPVLTLSADAGMTPLLAIAKRFESEAIAERFLATSYGPEARSYGVVVEIGT